jgi:hypothetical protein
VVQNFPTDYFKSGQSIGESPFNVTKVAGTALTARDWSGDFAKLQNLDTALSNVKTSIDNTNIAKISGTSLTARDWSSDFAKLQNLDTALSALQTLIRWSRNVTPAWVLGAENTAPAAGTALVSKTVSTGKTGYIYGFLITAQEANDFKINWTSGGSAKSYRIVFGGKGTMIVKLESALNEGLGADAGTSITVTNVNAGSAGIVYQCALLYAEV